MYNYFNDNLYFRNTPFFGNQFMPPRNIEVPFDFPNPYIETVNPMFMMHNPNYLQAANPYKKINKNILNLINNMRRLWFEHAVWTKLTIMSIANGSPDVQLVSERLLRNPDDFAKALLPLYGPTVSEQFRKLLREHLLIAADMVNAAKRKDNSAVNLIEKKLFKNADDIADFLSRINPYWDREDIRKMMYEHLTLLKSEAVATLSNKYEESISLFEKIENQVLIMADMFVEGILRQFPNKFQQ